MDNFMSTTEAAEKWGVSRVTVIAWLNRGKLPMAVKAGRDWLIPVNASRPADRRYVESPIRNRRKDK